MDFIITIALIYFAYRGYQWYTNVQRQARMNGGGQPPEVDASEFDRPTGTQAGDENDYIDYEEVKE